jgi:pimeloyl-ACP methyl ester carboxylesterase
LQLLRIPTGYEGNVIPAVFLPAEESPKTDVLLIYSHANAEDIGLLFDYASVLRSALGCAVLAYDYTGYGIATGGVSEKACFADGEAILRYATGLPSPEEGAAAAAAATGSAPPPAGLGFTVNQVVLYGFSLGSGVSSYLAARYRVRGLVVQSAFTSIYRVVLNRGDTTMMDHAGSWAADYFPNIDHIPNVECPSLHAHGTKDQIVPFAHGEELHQHAPFPASPIWIEGGSHNDVSQSEEFINGLLDFIQLQCGPGGGSGGAPPPAAAAASQQSEAEEGATDASGASSSSPASVAAGVTGCGHGGSQPDDSIYTVWFRGQEECPEYTPPKGVWESWFNAAPEEGELGTAADEAETGL